MKFWREHFRLPQLTRHCALVPAGRAALVHRPLAGGNQLLRNGAVQTRVQRLLPTNGRAQGLECVPVALNGAQVAGCSTRITARHVAVSGGAINSPALLMRSKIADPHRLLGTCIFLHPVLLSAATFEQHIEGWSGAPQTLDTDHNLDVAPIDGPIGYKLEAPPMHLIIFSLTVKGFGAGQAAAMKQFPHTHALLALLRDGSPELDYPLNDFIMAGARRALLGMAEIQFAAGAKTVTPSHERARPYASWVEARAAIAQLPMRPLLTRIFSAHVMGGCGMAGRADQGVVRPDGRHWQIKGLSVHDGSVFPTSVGANPQLSIHGLVAKLASGLAGSLTGCEARLA